MPEKMLERIDRERADINRSKYVLRLLEIAYIYQLKNIKKKDKEGRRPEEVMA
jgi:hypothetical protein